MRTLRPAISLLLALSLLTGLVYPLVITSIAQIAFPWRANGSLIAVHGTLAGSTLIGQAWSAPGEFWGRPSATAPQPYNGLASGGSNLGPTNPAELSAVEARIEALHAADPGNQAYVPVDLVTASGSGLDPEISLAAAEYQRNRVARARHIAPGQVQNLIDAYARRPFLGIIGEPRVNVLELNLALDGVPVSPVD
ncbi:MAG: potassium-transporting ATPase subunit KdpC [Betaproteobacteria bacterium]|nr:potassium-transporting ATPase subunit KdpC [Betaproteobacteria bacterium]